MIMSDHFETAPSRQPEADEPTLDLIQLDTVDPEEKIAKYHALISEATDPDVIGFLMVTRQNFLDKGEKIGSRLKELHESYADIIINSDNYC